VTESTIKYIGLDYIISIAKVASANSVVPLCLHLDHGSNFDVCKTCIDAGFSSVMIDKSSMPFENNVAETREVVIYAHSRGVSVEAELGILAGVEDDVNNDQREVFLTDPSAALSFVQKTDIDSLAVSIGTSHGPNKGIKSGTRLDMDRLSNIRTALGKDFPIVLHGASSVDLDFVEKCNFFGADIKNASGIPDENILNAIRNGVTKINIDTDIRLAFISAFREYLFNNKGEIDSRRIFKYAKAAVVDVVRHKIHLFTDTFYLK
jgi:fructose-bisphosphate aldolase class II